jgi:hypothetical protein
VVHLLLEQIERNCVGEVTAIHVCKIFLKHHACKTTRPLDIYHRATLAMNMLHHRDTYSDFRGHALINIQKTKIEFMDTT